MDLDRGTLAKVDRKVLSGLGHDESWQMVRVPVSEAMWSAWKRYCDAVGISMGRGIAGLIVHELGTVVSPETNPEALFASQLHRQLVARSEDLDARERRLKEQQRSLRAAEHRLKARSVPLDPSTHAGVGRNEPCPCDSGFKYKRCHGG